MIDGKVLTETGWCNMVIVTKAVAQGVCSLGPCQGPGHQMVVCRLFAHVVGLCA